MPVRLTPVVLQRPLRWPVLVTRVLEAAPDRPNLYLIGGTVRDALLDMPGQDIDLATSGSGLEVARQLANALDGSYYPLDLERKVGRIIITADGAVTHIDVASLRGDLLADLKARDFTINAMAVSAATPDQILDPLGGQQDLFQDRRLRQCSPTSIVDDPVRALRAVRFGLRLNLRLEAETRNAVRAAGSLLVNEAGELHQPERIRDEFFKVLMLPHPTSALRSLHMMSLLSPLVPGTLVAAEVEGCLAQVEDLKNLLETLSPYRSDNTASNLILGLVVITLGRFRTQLQEHLVRIFGDGRTRSAILLLATLNRLTEANGAAWASRFALSNAERDVLDSLRVPEIPEAESERELTDREIFLFYKRHGECGIDAMLIFLARYLADHRPNPDARSWGRLLENRVVPLIEAFFRRYQQVIAPPPLLTGDDLMQALNMKPGRELGQVLDLLVEEQAAGNIATRKQALRFAKRLRQDSQRA